LAGDEIEKEKVFKGQKPLEGRFPAINPHSPKLRLMAFSSQTPVSQLSSKNLTLF
jgi:hypothetical protein